MSNRRGFVRCLDAGPHRGANGRRRVCLLKRGHAGEHQNADLRWGKWETSMPVPRLMGTHGLGLPEAEARPG